MLYMSKVFDDKSRRKYGLISNFIYNLKAAREWNPRLFRAQILSIIPGSLGSLLGTYLPSRLVKDLGSHIEVPRLVLHMALITIMMWICNSVFNVLIEYCDNLGSFIKVHYAKKFVHKIMDMDYDYLEDENYQKISGNAWRVARFGQGVSGAIVSLPQFLSSMAGVFIYGFLLAGKSILLLLIIMFSLSMSLWLLSIARKKHAQFYEKLQLSARKEGYITAQTTESAAGKDIRLYHLLDWFLEKYDDALQDMGRMYGIIHDWYLFRNVSHAFLQLLMNAATYAFLIYLLTSHKITVAEFVFYVGLVSGFSLYFEDALRQIMSFNNTSASISYIREFLETEDRWKRGEGIGRTRVEQIRQNAVKLEFRDVSFTYPGNEKPTLKHINMVITPGDEFSRDEYYRLVSVLFQDATMLALSLDENLTGQNPEDIDRARLEKSLQLSNFSDIYEKLPQKGESLLVREINQGSTDFSGGEKQKMLFARTLYLNAPLVILDEPTAALDPIAENELYMNYGASMENKTGVYISHRLSSTRFCDRILLLEHGEIIEEGTHESLLAGNTRYAELFRVQSQYYKEEDERKRKSKLMGDAYETKTGKERGVFDE